MNSIEERRQAVNASARAALKRNRKQGAWPWGLWPLAVFVVMAGSALFGMWLGGGLPQ